MALQNRFAVARNAKVMMPARKPDSAIVAINCPAFTATRPRCGSPTMAYPDRVSASISLFADAHCGRVRAGMNAHT
jgi:hypothetical protein